MRSKLVVLATLVVLASCGHGSARPDADDQKPQVQAQKAEPDGTDGAIHLDRAAQARAQIKTTGLTVKAIGSSVTTYGTLEEDPANSYVARASVPGVLHAIPGAPWPVVGQKLKTGATFGLLQPRLAPAERIALMQQLETARSDVAGSTASENAARAAYERAKRLNADGKNFSDRALQEAEARLRSEQARLAAATKTAQVLQNSLDSTGQATGTQALIAERSGDVVEVLAQPGESVEQGVPIVRLTRLDRLLARIDIPIGTQISPSMAAATVVPSGYENQPPIRCIRLGFAAATVPNQQTTSMLFRLEGSRFGLRPGMSVTAYLPVAQSSRKRLVIPQSAVVRYGGRSFAYVQTAPEKFVRQEIRIDEPVSDGYAVNEGFHAGDHVVTVGAETLLSEEFKSKLQPDED